MKVRMKEKLTMKGARDRLWGRWRPALLFNHAGLCRIKIMSLLCLFLVALVVISRAASFMGWRHRLDSPQSLSRFLFFALLLCDDFPARRLLDLMRELHDYCHASLMSLETT